jgi:DNA-binding response OmpR family regulator
VSRSASPEASAQQPAVRRLLLVEDDSMLVRLFQRVLAPPDFEVEVAMSAEMARQRLSEAGVFDAMLLDVELPDQSGLDLLRGMRDAGDRTPVLILTGRDTDEDVVRGLDAGADDYLVKPVSASVLKARLRAAWRRSGDTPPEGYAVNGARVPFHVGVLSLNGLILDRLARRVSTQGREVDLTPKEFSLLEQLMLRPEDVVSRGELLEYVWQLQGDPGSNVVDAHVARLRQKLRTAAPCPEIQTVRGVGFRITAECGQGDDQDDPGSEPSTDESSTGQSSPGA